MPFTAKKLTPIKTDSLENLGNSVVDLAKNVEDEFGYVASALQATEPDHIWNSVPPRPRQGTTAYADGSNWNPGSGEGPYYLNQAGAWVPEFTSPATLTSITNLQSNKVQRVVQRVFTASGTYTPTAGLLYAILECIGPGGAGGGCVGVASGMGGGGGGGGGAYSRRIVTAALIGASQIVTIGAGGVPGAAGNVAGGNGTTTSIGALCTALGGTGGGAQNGITNLGAGGAGGVTGTGDFSIAGMRGGQANYNSAASGAQGYSGAGGNSGLGFGAGSGGQGQSGGSVFNGAAGSLYGGGGSGASFCAIAGNAAGGAGAAGLALVTEFCNA